MASYRGQPAIATIVRKEWRTMWRDGRAGLVMGTVLLVFGATTILSWQQADAVARERADAERVARAVWVGQGNKNPHAAAHYGTYVFRPVLPLTFFDRGLDLHAGGAIYLEAHRQNLASFASASDTPTLAVMGTSTAADVLQRLASLAIVLLAYGAFAREREDGTLRYVVSMGVPPHRLLLGKATALMVVVIGPLLLGLMGTLALSAWLGPSQASQTFLVLLALVVATYALYWVGVLAFTLAVSAWARTSRWALGIVLGAWILNAVVAVPVATGIAERMIATPSAAMFATAVASEIANGLDGHNPQDRRNQALRDTWLKQYGVSSVEDLPLNFAGIVFQASEEYSNQAFDRHFAALWDSYEGQARLERTLGLVAPLLAIRAISMGLAGTDLTGQRHFAEVAETYRRGLVKNLNDALAYESRPGEDAVAGADLWARIPPFTYQPRSLSVVLHNQWPGVAMLLAWSALGASTAWLAAGRMRTL